MSSHKHGSPDVWDDVFEGVDVEFSDSPRTQNQVFEHIKLTKLQQIFSKTKNKKMLEVGCGSAFVSLFFAKKGYNTSCLDINAVALRIAAKNYKSHKANGKFIKGNAEKLPFADNTFDVVTSFGLLEHFEDPTLAINEMVRVLKPKGVFFADIVPDRFSVQSLGNIFNFFASLVFGIAKGDPKSGFDKGMRNFKTLYFENSLSWQKYKKIINDAGIKRVSVYGNRPVARLTLPPSGDRIYAKLLLPFKSFWEKFDSWDNAFPRFWGAGWWFWGTK